MRSARVVLPTSEQKLVSEVPEIRKNTRSPGFESPHSLADFLTKSLSKLSGKRRVDGGALDVCCVFCRVITSAT